MQNGTFFVLTEPHHRQTINYHDEGFLRCLGQCLIHGVPVDALLIQVIPSEVRNKL